MQVVRHPEDGAGDRGGRTAPRDRHRYPQQPRAAFPGALGNGQGHMVGGRRPRWQAGRRLLRPGAARLPRQFDRHRPGRVAFVGPVVRRG